MFYTLCVCVCVMLWAMLPEIKVMMMMMIVQETHQEMRYLNVTSLYFAKPLAFNAPDGGFPLKRSP